MGKQAWWRLSFVLSALLLALCGAGCAGGRSGAGAPLQTEPAQEAALGEGELLARPALARELPVPEGVSSKVWSELTCELERVLMGTQNAELRMQNPKGTAKAPAQGSSFSVLHSDFLRAVSTPPRDAASASELVYDAETDELSWGYYSSGDYDQNGLVGISDLTPLGIHFGESSGGGGPFEPGSIESVVDGDGNGLINIADVTPIGAAFGLRLEGYRVYRSLSMDDWPEDAAAPNGAGAELVDNLLLSEASPGGDTRRMFTLAGIVPPDAGQMLYWVRPYDAEGEGTPSLPVLLEGDGPLPSDNFAPIGVLLAAPFNGLAPLSVEFQAWSSADIDGEIVKYEWDFDGPIGGEEWFDTGLEPFVSHLYGEPADYLATLRVTDDEGATDIDVFPVKVRTAIPPGASMLPSAYRGDAIFHVVLDGSSSDDLDGWIVDYSWDWNDDGVMDYSSGENPLADFYFHEPGNYWLTMQVTDNDGLKSVFRQDFRVDPGAVWHRNTALESRSTDTLLSQAHRLMSSQGLTASGFPGFFTSVVDHTTDPETHRLHFTRAADQLGEEWSEPAFVYEAQNYFSSLLHWSLVDGNPAGVFEDKVIGTTPSVRYIRAANAEGTVWPAPLLLEDVSHFENEYQSFMLAAGNPALFSGSANFLRADDPLGQSWGEPYLFAPLSPTPESHSLIGGRPAWFDMSTSLDLGYLMIADAPDGSSWPQVPQLIEDVFVSASGDSTLLELEGRPAVIFYSGIYRRLMIATATDAAGTDWREPLAIAYWLEDASHKAAVLSGRPAVIYTDLLEGQLMFRAANDAAGLSWALPVALRPDEIPVELYHSMRLTESAGAPAVLVERQEPDPEVQPNGLIHYIDYVNFH